MPRGALLGETLDLLDRLGFDTAEVRANDRKLLFEDAGLVTMRPSDVPIYVEAGAADLGITGKDVLSEHPERDVYELVDLGFGPCRMVFATEDGEDRAAEALRRLGVMRVATKYPRIAAAYFERTGRQAEIVEVKGSVELAPLTGLVHGIVDLTATGTTLRENGLVIREEIAASTARLIANPVAHKLKAAAIDDVVARIRGARRPPASRSAVAAERLTCTAATAAEVAARVRAGVPPGASVADDVREIVAAVRAGGDEALIGYERRFGGGERAARVRATSCAAALDGAGRRTCAPGSRWRSPTCARWPRRGSIAESAATLPQGHTVRLREQPGRARRDLRPRGAQPVPVDRRDGRGHRPRRRRRRGGRRRRRASRDPGRVRAVRGRRRVPDGRRAGDRRARLRHGDASRPPT